MDIATIDQVIRPEPAAANGARRSADSNGPRFSNLLETKTERPSTERAEPAGSRTAHRAERSDNKDPAEKSARAERRDRMEQKDRPARDDKPRKIEKSAKDEAAEPAQTARKTAPATDNSQRADIQKIAAQSFDDTSVSIANAADSADVAMESEAVPTALAFAVQSDLQTDLVAIAAERAAPIATPLAALAAAPIETQTGADDTVMPPGVALQPTAQAPANPFPDTAAAAQKAAAEAAELQTQELAKPTSTLAEQNAQATSMPAEDYADFMLRNLAAASANVATSDEDSDMGKADAKTKDANWSVTIAPTTIAAVPVAPQTALAVQAVANNDNGAIDATVGGNAAAVLPDDAEGKPVAKSIDPSTQFAQILDQARTVSAPDDAKTAARAQQVPPHEQVAVHVRKAVADGIDQITIRLNPVELGRIDVKLEVASDGTLRAAFAADRPQTLELLKNDSRQLERALSEAGLSTDAGGLNFSLRGDNRENAQAFRHMSEEFARKRSEDPAATDASAPVATGSYARRNAGAGRLDLNV